LIEYDETNHIQKSGRHVTAAVMLSHGNTWSK